MRESLNLMFLFLAVWLACAVEHGFSYGAPLENKYPLGTIGCLFTDNLCQIDEECVDDLLFGNCQQSNTIKDYYQYQLSRKALESLEKLIRHLIKGDYSWRDAYTQCVLQNALLVYHQQKSFDIDICHDLKITDGSWTEGVNKDLSEVLQKVLQGYYTPSEDSSIEENNLGISESNKRDEIIHVHKYFDKSMEPHRKRQYDDAGSSAMLDDQNDLHYLPEYYSPYRKRTKSPEGISLEDIQMLQYYLQNLRNSPDLNEVPDLDLNYNVPYMALSDSEFDRQASENSNYIPVDNNNIWIDLAPSEGKTDDNKLVWSEGEESKDSVDVSDSLTPEYANLLGKLLQGKVKAESLTDEELSFLSKYVNKRLQQLGYTPKEISLIGKETNEDVEKLEGPQSEKVDDPLTDLAASLDESLNPSPSYSEGEEKTLVFDESNMGSPMETDKKTIGFPVAGEVFNPESKKSSEDPDKGDNPSLKDVVNVDYAFVDFSEDQETAQGRIDKFIEKLQELTGVKILNPFDDFKLSSTPSGGSRLTFEVLPESGLNASQVTDVAEKYKDDLATYSQLTVVDTGLGKKENQVSSKRHDNRYFELTFVLCGCIAGILLAVVVIYLIRRHSRSKEKLARLATTGEGTEASKDYQDLCRQRMQSKSSEKPEPLHAASRIGSVSETQVRSPSSRSSTSSWSEEPVSNNMDISTGHIVLSYMEDHLKNKDRLDREWENLCSYEADPSSTKVASDAANMRKNRYSDILPYDHSRVILSNTNNVSSSDYINASSITDHDPRNPAYIATQGPLPHTIADFWQMVWEQGSVVIVMLTKLTENGEAMCHRYWPEEGSDLYHTYEVNLVSEHVWCDDYLVRSFYLKNVQTAETRTVTQFHFLTWQDLGVPGSIKALLDFRRKVNKSYRGRSCPIVVHCSDGCGRTGTYALIDMVLNRMAKGAKEIDIAATLEHIRDQRMNMVKTKEQFQFALAAVAEEVHAILKALPQ